MRALSFARSIAARHLRRTAIRPSVSRVLVRRASRVVRALATRNGSGHAIGRLDAPALRLHLTMRLTLHGPRNDGARPSRVVSPPGKPWPRTWSPRRVERSEEVERRGVVDRVLTLSRRVERATSPSSTIVLKSAAPVPVARPEPVETQLSAPAVSRQAPPPLRTTLDARELSRVTDAVMQSIDHRLRASRERRGRV